VAKARHFGLFLFGHNNLAILAHFSAAKARQFGPFLFSHNLAILVISLWPKSF
jgi:hypothetical protein